MGVCVTVPVWAPGIAPRLLSAVPGPSPAQYPCRARSRGSGHVHGAREEPSPKGSGLCWGPLPPCQPPPPHGSHQENQPGRVLLAGPRSVLGRGCSWLRHGLSTKVALLWCWFPWPLTEGQLVRGNLGPSSTRRGWKRGLVIAHLPRQAVGLRPRPSHTLTYTHTLTQGHTHSRVHTLTHTHTANFPGAAVLWPWPKQDGRPCPAGCRAGLRAEAWEGHSTILRDRLPLLLYSWPPDSVGHTLRGRGAANRLRAGPWTLDTSVWKARRGPRAFHTQHRWVSGAPPRTMGWAGAQTYLQPFRWTPLKTALTCSRVPPNRAPHPSPSCPHQVPAALGWS